MWLTNVNEIWYMVFFSTSLLMIKKDGNIVTQDFMFEP